ncbi:MAG TPA: 6-phosphogluconolactonase, partial [Candidatus Saccharimonadales bacterium]|nr:6-phosphogluconolactonase [Candidatus Saccharimonadales bacterium]
SRLTIMQIDERYGPVGHPDSNWQQLQAAGLKPGSAEPTIAILAGQPLAATVERYTAELAEQLRQADVRVGLLGLGADGHTAGILPHSPAVTETALVASYRGEDFERITITGAAMAQLDEAIVYAAGGAKWPQLERLQTDQPAPDQPAQLLKQASRLLIINDSVGDHLGR